MPRTVLALWGSGAFQAGGSDVANLRLGTPRNNRFRKGIIDIDVFEPPFYHHGKVGWSRALQPQQHFLAQCLQNQRETLYFVLLNLTFPMKDSIFS